MLKGSFPMSKVLVFEGNSYVCWKKMKILDNFMIAHGKECDLKALFLWQKFSFSRVIATYVEKMNILDNFIIAHGKECDQRLFSYVKSFSFQG